MRIFSKRFVKIIFYVELCSNFSPETFAQNLRPGNLCTNVRGRICAEFVSGFWAPKCAGRICADLCGGEFARRVVSGCSSTLCAGVRRENLFFGDVRGVFFSHRRCARGCFRGCAGEFGPENGRRGAGGPKKGQKGPKMPKMAQNGPKWPKRGGCPKRAQNGTFCPRVVHEWFGGHCV